MVLVGIVVHLSARQWVNRGRRQGNVGPVGAVGFCGFGSGLGLLLLPSLPTWGSREDAFEGCSRRKSNCEAKINYKRVCAWHGAANYGSCFSHVTNGFFSRTQFEANTRPADPLGSRFQQHALEKAYKFSNSLSMAGAHAHQRSR